MIFVYRVLFLPLMLLMMPYYALRMLRRGGYAKDFSHRFGRQKNLPKVGEGKTRLWIQAVSVGEVEALSSLIKKLSESGKYELVITTTTSTAYKILQEKYAKYCLYVGVFPFDFYFFNKAAWQKIKPDVCALMEGELWPEHIHRAKLTGTPLLLLNARVSDKSFRRYKKIYWLAKRIFTKPDFVAASSEFDMKRLLELGVSPEKIENVGNLKFDSLPEKILSEAEKKGLKKEMGFLENSLVLLGSSTWQGEEEMLVEALFNIRKTGIDCRLLLVPRHAERREEIRTFLNKSEKKYHFRSEAKEAKEDTLVYVADTTGELKILTQAADFSFVGKSLPPNNGGQTPIDCAALNVAIVYGPNMTNFRLLCKTLEEIKAVIKVQNKSGAIKTLELLAQDFGLRNDLAKKAKTWHSSNLGASEKTFNIIEKFAKK